MTLIFPDEAYSRNVPCTLNYISIFLLLNKTIPTKTWSNNNTFRHKTNNNFKFLNFKNSAKFKYFMAIEIKQMINIQCYVTKISF